MKKIIALTLAILMSMTLIGCVEESERNKIGSSIDWGDGYYWDSNTESVQKKLW